MVMGWRSVLKILDIMSVKEQQKHSRGTRHQISSTKCCHCCCCATVRLSSQALVSFKEAALHPEASLQIVSARSCSH